MAASRTKNVDKYTRPAGSGLYIPAVTLILSSETSSLYGVKLSVVKPYVLTYLLTPWSRTLLKKLTGFQLVKKFPAIYATRRFITAFTSARHLSLSCASDVMYSYYLQVQRG